MAARIEGNDDVAGRGDLSRGDACATGRAPHLAGLLFDASSEVNASSRDTPDHPEGVWTLPATLRLGERHRERDQMPLRLRKSPAREVMRMAPQDLPTNGR